MNPVAAAATRNDPLLDDRSALLALLRRPGESCSVQLLIVRSWLTGVKSARLTPRVPVGRVLARGFLSSALLPLDHQGGPLSGPDPSELIVKPGLFLPHHGGVRVLVLLQLLLSLSLEVVLVVFAVVARRLVLALLTFDHLAAVLLEVDRWLSLVSRRLVVSVLLQL